MIAHDTKNAHDNQRPGAFDPRIPYRFSTFPISDVFRAYAKINLGLYVVEKRPDGFHNILTVFHRIDLHDTISFSPSSDVNVESTDPAAPGGVSNLCHRAAEALREHTGVSHGVRITLEKRIPVGAGLGGGSSDAATVLLHLPQFWGIEIDSFSLHILALELGSDVPYFLGAGSAMGRGRGEILEYFPLEIPFAILLCNPNIHIATGWAFSCITPGPPMAEDLRRVLTDGMHDPGLLRATLSNDFEPAVFSAHPAIGELKQEMLKGGAVYAAMSGSGSSVFGFFPTMDQAETLAGILRAKGLRSFVTPPLFRS